MDWLKDDGPKDKVHSIKPWKVAIVDDDVEVHKITELALKSFNFEQRSLSFIHAYSGAEAKTLINKHSDIAILLLDVVMEDDDAGLNVVKYVREELDNHSTRIILRTGQPGSAPKEDVIQNYDIDGYKSKAEISRSDLIMQFYTALRSYRDIVNIQQYRNGLEAVINAMLSLAEMTNVEEFAGALLTQLAVVLNSNKTEFVIQDSETFALSVKDANSWELFTNRYEVKLDNEADVDNDFKALAKQALANKQSVNQPPLYAHYYRSKTGSESVFILRNSQPLSDYNRHLLEIFSKNAIISLNHLIQSNKSN